MQAYGWLVQALIREGSTKPSKRQTAVAQDYEIAASQAVAKPWRHCARCLGGARCAALVLGGVLQHYDAAACVDQTSRQCGAEARALGTPVSRAMLRLDCRQFPSVHPA